MTALGAPRELTGTRDQVKQTLARLHEVGALGRFTPPEPHPHGCRVWWWMRQPAEAQPVRRPLPSSARPAWTPRDLTHGQRQAVKVGGALLGAGALLAGVVWLIVRAVSGVWSAAAGNPFLAWLVVVLVVVGGWKWVTRERAPKASSGGGCPGITCHCQGCRGH